MGYISKVLIVDDEKDVVEVLSKIIKEAGYDVISAYDGEEALVKVKENNPDVIILDLIMPKLNGFEVLKALRSKDVTKWIPAVIVSAKSDLESIKKSYDLEAELYITKPCAPETLLRGISTLISLIPQRKIKE
ncbi:MAG: response regulator [Candidatus Omnitrophica bacterium]|nr:response regulator [Candidatus Omnitrophota bacterium]